MVVMVMMRMRFDLAVYTKSERKWRAILAFTGQKSVPE